MAGSADQPRRSFSNAAAERRSGLERRAADRRSGAARQGLEGRGETERRIPRDRRTKLDRRTEETAEEHIRNALQLLGNVAEAGDLSDEVRRDLDSAMLRLRFAVDRLEQS
ncbi:MAG TPA: hypothetical protein VN848_12055 [Gemmatimonadales bacterium]|nr:hypothetical protein [Gemmatimonadales bacterium]